MRNLLVLCVALAWSPPKASASPLIEQTGGFGGMGALQARHAGPSAASAYFNPSLLVDAEQGATFGALLLNTEIGIKVDARAASEAVPDGLVNAVHADGSRLSSYPVATSLLQGGRTGDAIHPPLDARPRQHAGSGHQTLSYEAIGLVVKLVRERVALGFYGLVPNRDFTRFKSFYPDEREQYSSNSLHPELYGDRMSALSIAFAAGVRVTDSLSLGVGATLGLIANANAPVYVADAGRLNDLQLNLDANVHISLVPHGGISWRPAKRWHLTGTVHAPQKLEVKASFTFLLATGIEQGSSLGFTYFYQPWQVGAGLGYDFYTDGHTTFTATGSLLYGRWSKYIDRQSDRPGDAYAWQDTLSAAAGVRMRDGPVALALEGQYKPTPIPAQTGRTNYVDNDRFGLAFALEYAFALWNLPLKLGAQVQCARLIEQHSRKHRPPTNAQGQNRTPQLVSDEVPDDAVSSGRPVAGRDGLQTNNPGWPGFWSTGWVSSVGLYFTVTL